MSDPWFDRPNFTCPVADTAGVDSAGFGEIRELPDLIEGDGSQLGVNDDEALVLVEHRRVRVLANYWHGGWRHAIPATWLRRGVAERLYAVADSLPDRWGLAVFDGWRPLTLQQELYDAAVASPATEPEFMAPVSTDPATPPPHLTGAAVDLTLTFDTVPLAPGTGFDDTTALARATALEGTDGADRDVRRALYWSMRAQGFVVFAGEWWHFELGTRRWSLVTGGRARYGPALPPG